LSRPPDAQETLLLSAALERGPHAIAAWQRWREANDFDGLDGESVRIVPLLYRNLARQGVPADATLRYASVYRHTWAANRLCFKACARALGLFREAGIETLLLKGAAMTLLHYRDSGVRSMADVDVLVRPERARDAAAILAAEGWRGPDVGALFPMLHAAGHRDAHGHGIDLHWYAALDARWPGADAAFWEAAVPVRFEWIETRALAPTDLLYTVLAHGYGSFAPHLRWAADAATLVRDAAIDWPRLVRLAETRRLVRAVHAQLAWLRARLGVAVPDEVMAQLASSAVPWIDRLEHAHWTSARPFTPEKVLLRLWCWYRRTTDARGLALALGFPGWLRSYRRLRAGA
jgi:hypothetical protein